MDDEGNPVRISLVGVGSESFASDLKAAGVDFETGHPQLGEIVNSGEWIDIVQSAAPWGALAAVMCAWLRARASRKIILTQKDNTILHVDGLGVEEVEKLLAVCKRADVFDTKNGGKRKK